MLCYSEPGDLMHLVVICIELTFPFPKLFLQRTAGIQFPTYIFTFSPGAKWRMRTRTHTMYVSTSPGIRRSCIVVFYSTSCNVQVGARSEGVFLSLMTDVCGTLNAGSLSSMSSTGRYNYYINTSILHYIGMIGSEIKNVHPYTGGMPFRDLESPHRNH
jgi:hypothetical protein